MLNSLRPPTFLRLRSCSWSMLQLGTVVDLQRPLLLSGNCSLISSHDKHLSSFNSRRSMFSSDENGFLTRACVLVFYSCGGNYFSSLLLPGTHVRPAWCGKSWENVRRYTLPVTTLPTGVKSKQPWQALHKNPSPLSNNKTRYSHGTH